MKRQRQREKEEERAEWEEKKTKYGEIKELEIISRLKNNVW